MGFFSDVVGGLTGGLLGGGGSSGGLLGGVLSGGGGLLGGSSGLGGLTGGILGGGGNQNAGSEAAQLQAQGQQNAIAELQRQFGITQEQLAPFLEAGTQALPQVQQGATAGGLDERLGEIFQGGSFQNLVGERTRAVQNQLAAGGQTRSGAGLLEAARVPTELGFGIEQLLTGRQTGLAGQGQQAAANLGGIGAQASQGIAGQLAGIGQTRGSGVLADAQAGAAQQQALLNTGVAAASIFFSDPRLKMNIRKIGRIVDLDVHEWDWRPETKGTIIDGFPEKGFLSTEVREKYPQFVSTFGGFDVINMTNLLNELEVSRAHA